jgi:hypothetical protein
MPPRALMAITGQSDRPEFPGGAHEKHLIDDSLS